MKRMIFAATVAVLGLTTAVHAQDADPAEESISNDATVERGTVTEQQAVVDENGAAVLDENGDPVYETRSVGSTQTVTTPSGIVHTMTKIDGENTVVEHDRSAMAKPERPQRPERAEKPEKPQRAEKPEKPERPEKPEKGGRS